MWKGWSGDNGGKMVKDAEEMVFGKNMVFGEI